MRILQLIDSLEVGGAERMAVNYANSLSKQIEFSGIVVTRKEGSLKSILEEKVSYLFLNRKKVFDLKALFLLKSYCKENKIDFIHAHGTSFFIAFLFKIIHPTIKVIWHEHAGARGTEKRIQNRVLWFCTRSFSGILVVNHTLENWFKIVLKFKNTLYLPNFTVFDTNEKPTTFLKGIEHKRIVCLANLRHPKNHKLLVEVAIKTKETHPEWTFHFIGNDLQDGYSSELKGLIETNHLEDTVFIYGLCEDTNHILQQSTIAVLASLSEGLPVALLEYGMHKKPVVATNVGEIPLIISDGITGFIVPSDTVNLFYNALVTLMESEILQSKFGKKLYDTIIQNHSEKAVIKSYLNWLKKI